MEMEPVQVIRENTRNLLKISRRAHKDQENDNRRSIREIRITPENVASIASKLKKKSSVTAEDLYTLKNGLMDGVKHIEVFLNVHGALRGLVRELTGHNAVRQYEAAGCLCNLSLGDSRACSSIAKAAGSYLVAALDSLTVDLAVTCAWTIGNLAGSGPNICSILAAQGALSKLSELHTDGELQGAAVYAMLHFAYHMRDEMRLEHLQKILQTLSKLELTMASMNLMFILSCHDHFSLTMPPDLLEHILKVLPESIQTHHTCKQTDLCCKLVYIIRVLANSEQMYANIINYFVTNNIFSLFKTVLSLNNVCINNSIFWLLGNLLNYCGDEKLFLDAIS